MEGEQGQEPAGEQLSEEEMRAQLEEEIRKVRVEDVVLQSVVSILNLSARRIAKDDERDLDQAKVGIDAAGAALLPLVPEDAQSQLKQAISELQLLYAKHSGPSNGGDDDDGEGGGEEPKSAPEQPKPGSGSSEGGPGLWTPPTAG